MSQLVDHPGYVQIADLLDSVGQRYRVYCILRGVIAFAALLAGGTVAAAVLAGLVGPGFWASLLAGAYAVVMFGALVWWVLRPVFLRPRPLQIARMIENRVPEIFNGLTNTVQLANADDLQKNTWLGEIFTENAKCVSARPLSSAVRFRDLSGTAIRSWALAIPLLILALLMPGRLAQGFGQMLKPAAFVPVRGAVVILEVLPGSTTVIKGRSFDMSVAAKGPGGSGEFTGTVYFEDEKVGHPLASAAGADDQGVRHFTFVREHVDESTRYRVEVGGTQSAWYSLTAIKQVGMQQVTVIVTPPAYTRLPAQTITLPAADVQKQPITVAQGSKLMIGFDLDVAVSAGMIQAGEASPVLAAKSTSGQHFSGELVPRTETPISLLLTDGGGQIIARVPAEPLIIHVTPDTPPAIEMKWPMQDVSVAPDDALRVEANLKDDYGLVGAKLYYAFSADEPMLAAADRSLPDKPVTSAFSAVLKLKPEQMAHGKSVWIQLEATDNRDLTSLVSEWGSQSVQSRKLEIRFRDPKQIAKESAEKDSKIRQRLEAMLKQQKELHEKTLAAKPADMVTLQQVQLGQSDLRTTMLNTAQTFDFDSDTRVIQKTLQALAGGTAQEAVTFAQAAISEQVPQQRARRMEDLTTRQRRVMQMLESLLAMLNISPDLQAQGTQKRGSDMDNPKLAYEKLSEALKQFMKEEQRILDQSAMLAKKPVDNFDEKDKKLLEDLKMAQEKLDAFMQEKVHDFSNVAEQDMANAALLKELLEVYSEVTMAKDALKDKAMEIAVAAEENGLELAKETNSNLEKWLSNKPDRQKWTQEDQLQRTEAPAPELPAQLEDMVGELMEQQEDLFDEMEDANTNWHDSLDKGAGWDAADGPIDDMSAKGVTGNQLPNNNEMGGRAGEGRSGKSQGEMVEDTAKGKGGRNTPTRLDPTAFQKGQVKDESKDPTGGATGGGKLSGQGGQGLQGPVGPKQKEEMQRLSQKQAELRNAAERLDLKYKLGKYDNFKLLESIAIMRRVESDMKANRYQTAMRRKDIMLDAMDESRTLLAGQISVQHDTTPTGNRKMQQDISDAMKGAMPPAWEGALKEYYKKLGQE